MALTASCRVWSARGRAGARVRQKTKTRKPIGSNQGIASKKLKAKSRADIEIAQDFI
jgi:hypothetical protein